MLVLGSGVGTGLLPFVSISPASVWPWQFEIARSGCWLHSAFPHTQICRVRLEKEKNKEA